MALFESEPIQGAAEYGGQWSFLFKPDPEDLPHLVCLVSKLFQQDSSEHQRLLKCLNHFKQIRVQGNLDR
jgi:hypothetical protein